MKRRGFLCLLPTLAAACSTAQPAPLSRLRIAAGQPGGVYHALSSALARVAQQRWSIPAEALTTTESIENLRMVSDGRADLGFATIDAAVMALDGDHPFRQSMPIAALASVYEDYLHIVVPAGSGIKTIANLAGKRIAIGPQDSGSDIVAIRVLRTAALSDSLLKPVSLPSAEALARLRSGALDGFLMVGGVPTPALRDLAGDMPIELIGVPFEASEMQDAYGVSYQARSIPIGTYGLRREVPTVGIPNVLVAHAQIPEHVAAALTDLLFAAKPWLTDAHEQARRLDPRSSMFTYQVPLHAGAASYYRAGKPFLAAPQSR